MWKVVYKHLYTLTLPGFILLAAFVISSGASVLWGTGNASAAVRTESNQTEDCTTEHKKPVFGSNVLVKSDEVVCGNLTAWGGDITIEGVVKGDVVTFGGNIIVDGRVDGTVRSYVGNVTLRDGAQIYGDIDICGGMRTEDSASQLHGTVFDCPRSVELLLAGMEEPNFRFWALLTWVALGLLLTSLLPEHVMLVRTTTRSKTRRSLLLGILSVLLAPTVLSVLVALIISIPLAIIVAIGLIAGWALGTVAVGWLIGEYIVSRVIPQQNTRSLQIVVGLAVLVLAGSLPIIGWFISVGAGLLGLGAVFLSRFGTRLYSQPKQPLSL